jgi:hypothetical protein
LTLRCHRWGASPQQDRESASNESALLINESSKTKCYQDIRFVGTWRVRKDTGIWGTPQFQHMCMTILCGVGIRPLIISTSTGFPQVPRSNPTSPEGNLGNGSNGGGRLSMPERPADVLWYTNMLSWPTTLGRNDLRCTTYGSQGLCAPNSRVVASKRERMMCSFQLLHTASETRNGSLSHDHGTFGNTKVGRRQRLVHYINAETAPTTTMEHVHPSAYTCPPSTASSSPSPSSSLSHSHFSPGHALSGTHLLPVLP